MAAVATGVAAEKIEASGVDEWLKVIGRLAASFASLSFISLLLCFSVTVFCFR